MTRYSAKFKPIPGPATYTPEWYACRVYDPNREIPVRFGASESAAMCGHDPYTTTLEMFMRKRGVDLEKEETVAMKIGKALEPVILRIYEEEAKAPMLMQPAMHFSPHRPWLAATPDALRLDDVGNWERTVDAKSSNYRRIDKTGDDETKFGTDGTDEIPIEYMFQAQHQLAVFNLDVADFAVLFDREKYGVYTIYRNENIIDEIESCAQEMLERLKNNDPPEPTWEHASTTKLLRELYGYNVGQYMIFEDAHEEMWAQYQLLGKEIEQLEEERTALKNKLIATIGDNEGGMLPTAMCRLKRVQIGDSVWSLKDIETAQQKLGQVKRKGYIKLQKVKL